MPRMPITINERHDAMMRLYAAVRHIQLAFETAGLKPPSAIVMQDPEQQRQLESLLTISVTTFGELRPGISRRDGASTICGTPFISRASMHRLDRDPDANG